VVRVSIQKRFESVLDPILLQCLRLENNALGLNGVKK
jgi:hypothetical protein